MTASPARFIAGLLLFTATGCAERPKAPPLVNETSYQNDKIGLRFLAPEGWSLSSRADLPETPLPRPVILVAYHLSKGGYLSELEVMAADLPEGTDPANVLVEHRIGPVPWVLKPPAETVTINGAEATRHVLTRQVGKGEVRREATVFRRGSRVYFFIITFATGDAPSRDAAHDAVKTVTWTK